MDDTDGKPIDLSTEPQFYFSAVNSWDDTYVDFASDPPSSALMPISGFKALSTPSGEYISQYNLNVSNLNDGIYVAFINTVSAGYYQAVGQFSVIGGMSSPEVVAGHAGPYLVSVNAVTPSGDSNPNIDINGTSFVVYDSNGKWETGWTGISTIPSAEFYLPSGSHILGAYNSGYSFESVPFDVSGDTDITIYGSTLPYSPPASASLCEIRGNIITLGGAPVSGLVVEFCPIQTQTTTGGNFLLVDSVRTSTDASGNFSASIVSGTNVVVYSESAIKSYKFSVPYLEYVYLQDIIS